MNLNIYNAVGIEYLQAGKRLLMGRRQTNFENISYTCSTEPGKRE